MSFVLTGIVESTGSADAGKIPVLGDTGVLDASVLPSTALAGVPTGAVQAFAMTTVPSGWLACDGSTVSRADYAELFAAIGVSFGEGDGSTTFNVPNLKDTFTLGLGSTYATIGTTGGEVTHTLTTAEIPAHTHQSYFGWSGSGGATLYQSNTIYEGNQYSAATSSIGGGSAHNNMPPYIVLNYCIKY